MKILFINPVISQERDKMWERVKLEMFTELSFIPRLAPMILAALTPEEHEFTYLDEDVKAIDFERIEADLIAITAMTIQAKRAYYLADRFREMGYPVIIGGIHASSCPEEAALHADAVCTGEAENYWQELLQDAATGQLKKFYHGKDYPKVRQIPIPKMSIINHDAYSAFPIQATRGCPYNCEFCCIKLSSGHEYRKKPVEQVIAEIEECEKLNNGPIKKRYYFNDDNLYVDRDYTMELFKGIAPLNIQWMGMGSVDIAQDEEVLEAIAKSGCRIFYIGFESISEESLKQAHKKCGSIHEYKAVAKKLIKHGIVPGGFFVFGFDNEDEEVFKRTADFTIQNRIIISFFNIMTPYPGTALYERKKDTLIDYDWNHYSSFKCVYQPANLTPAQIEAGLYEASGMAARLDVMKDHMKYFWSHGPWEKNPRLKLRERVLLLVMAVKMRKRVNAKKFLLWSAFQYKAVDLNQIMLSVFYII